MQDLRDKISSKIRIEDKKIIREILAETIGTFFLVFIGTSANVQAAMPGGSIVVATIAWGIGFMFAVYLAASVSGAHLNPAISVAQFLLGNISMVRMFIYWIAQLIGGFLGAGLTFFGHYDDIQFLDGGDHHVTGDRATAGLFATYPTPHMSTWGSLFDQIIGTAMLSGLVCLITDKRHKIPTGFVAPLAGAVMTMIASTFGANGGFAINPARDLGPRLFLLCSGYGGNSFSAHSFYFWIPIVGPLIGAVIGAWIYKLFVGLHGLNETLDVTPAAKGFNQNGDTGVLIGYTNSLGGTLSSRNFPSNCMERTIPPPIPSQAPPASYSRAGPTGYQSYQTSQKTYQQQHEYHRNQ